MAEKLYLVRANGPLLHAQLAAAAGVAPATIAVYTRAGENWTRVVWPATVAATVIDATVAAHTPDALTTDEQQQIDDNALLAALRTEYLAIKTGAAQARTLLGTEADWGALIAAERERRTRLILLGLTNHLENVADALRVVVRRLSGA
jgi:hypothetical protein